MLELPEVTLIIIECVECDRARQIRDLMRKQIDFGDVKILSHHDAFDLTRIPDLDYAGYNTFKIRKLTNYVSTDFALCAEWDGFVLNRDAWDFEFLNYDYIGATWPDGTVGNGGFSLRSKRLLDRLASEAYDYDDWGVPEDEFICRFARSDGMIFAPQRVADIFSVENGQWDGQFGFHSYCTDISRWRAPEAFGFARHYQFHKVAQWIKRRGK